MVKYIEKWSTLFHLTHESELEYSKWSRRIISTTWLFAVIVLFVELAIFAMKKINGGAANTLEYLTIYIFIPTIANFLLLTITTVLSNILIKRSNYGLQGVVYLFCLSLICFVLAWTHSAVPVIYMIFGIPILISLSYVEKKLLQTTFIINIFLYVIYIVILYFNAGKQINIIAPDFMDTLTAAAMILVCYMISRMILTRLEELLHITLVARELSTLDSLTGLYNHAFFYDRLGEFIQEYHKKLAPFALIIIDIDNFKSINDTFGHHTGNLIIKLMADIIRENLASEEPSFRYGGEEFTILTSRIPDNDLGLVKKILKEFETKSTLRYDITVTASIGICRYNPQLYSGHREFFAAADQALYKAKLEGKNCYRLCDEQRII